MFTFIRSNYKKGDKLHLRTISGEVLGEIIALNEDSIILKSFDGKICGIKGDDISFFEEISNGVLEETDLIDKANALFKKEERIFIPYNNLYKANRYGDFGDNYYCYEFNNEIRINIGTVNYTGKAKQLKEIIDSNYNKQCEFDVELENPEKEHLYINKNEIGLGIGEPRWWMVEILEPSLENPTILEEQLDDYYVLCYIVFKKGQYPFIDSLYSKLKNR